MTEKKKAKPMTDEQLGVAINTLRGLSELYWLFMAVLLTRRAVGKMQRLKLASETFQNVFVQAQDIADHADEELAFPNSARRTEQELNRRLKEIIGIGFPEVRATGILNAAREAEIEGELARRKLARTPSLWMRRR